MFELDMEGAVFKLGELGVWGRDSGCGFGDVGRKQVVGLVDSSLPPPTMSSMMHCTLLAFNEPDVCWFITVRP